MKLLKNKDNVNAPDAAFPFGSTRDKTVSVAGSKWNNEMMNDQIQFFEKVFDESGLTANGDLDNESNGFQLYEAMRKVFRPYKSYTALLTQTSTNDPVVTVLENTLGITLAHSRDGVGEYSIARSSGSWDATKTVVLSGGTAFYNRVFQPGLDGVNMQYQTAFLSETTSTDPAVSASDGVLAGQTLEIRVYD